MSFVSGGLRAELVNMCIPAHLVFIRFVSQVFDQQLHTLCWCAFPIGPSVWTQRFVPSRQKTNILLYNYCQQHKQVEWFPAECQNKCGEHGLSYRWRKISYLRRYANPARRTLRCSISPRYFTWCRTSTSSKRPTGDNKGHLVQVRRITQGCLDHKISPGCLASLGLMQRTYQGSLDIRISVRSTRLFLNWVTTWGGE